MGCSVYGNAIVGLQVPWSKVCKGKKKVKAFEHNHPKDWSVDPKTGKKLWHEENVFIAGWEGEYAGEEFLCDYEVVRDYEDPDYAIICLSRAETRNLLEGADPVRGNLPDAFEINDFKDKMEKIGLWDPLNFGLWAYGQACC